MRHLRARRRDDRGAAAVEFALIAPILLLLVFGIIAFGFAFFRMQAASHAAREGARLAAVGVESCTDFVAAVRARGEGAKIEPASVPGVRLAYTGTAAPGGEVVVEVRHKLDLSLLGWVPGIPQNVDRTETGRARVEVVKAVKTTCTG